MSENNSIPTLVGGEQVLELLRQAVAEKGRSHVPPLPEAARDSAVSEYNENGCYYRDFTAVTPGGGEYSNEFVFEYPEGEPVPLCGVGYAFHYLGILDQVDERSNTELVFRLPIVREGFTVAAKEILTSFQYVQDEGKTWGEALDNAEATAARLDIIVKQA